MRLGRGPAGLWEAGARRVSRRRRGHGAGKQHSESRCSPPGSVSPMHSTSAREVSKDTAHPGPTTKRPWAGPEGPGHWGPIVFGSSNRAALGMGTSLICTASLVRERMLHAARRDRIPVGGTIPGLILPEANWARTGVKRLPEPGPLDWTSFFGRESPVVLDLGCGNGRFTLAVRLPGLITTTAQSTNCPWSSATPRAEPTSVGSTMSGSLSWTPELRCLPHRRGLCRRGPSLPSPTLSRSPPDSSPGHHAAIPGQRPPGSSALGSSGDPDRQSRLLELHGPGDS